jgi:hypothetical protein
MPRITVTTDTTHPHREPTVVLDEHVQSELLSTGNAAAQLVERLAWAVIDAEQQRPARTPVRGREQVAAHDATQDPKRPTRLRPLKRVAFFSSARAA